MTTEGGAGYMNGLFIYKDKKYIDQVVGTSTLSLLAKKDDFEIMLYEIKADRPNSITPGDFPDLMEFYYIIEGALEIKDGGNFVKLNKGDYFFVSNIKETVPVRTIEDTKMLYISSRPVYNLLFNRAPVTFLLIKGFSCRLMHLAASLTPIFPSVKTTLFFCSSVITKSLIFLLLYVPLTTASNTSEIK